MNEIQLPSGLSVLSHLDKRVRPPVDYQKTIEAARILQEQQRSRELWQPEASVKITTRDPVLVTYFGDLHIGNIEVQYDKLFEMFLRIKEGRNHFAVFAGDDVDNAFIFREGGNADILTYEMQGELAKQSIGELDQAGKVLFSGSGNHNRFVQNWYDNYYRDFQTPLIGPNMGTCHVGVGDQNYDISYFHKITMGNSTMSPFLREQRAVEYWFPNSDIIIGAHTHRKGVAQYNIGLDGNKRLRTMIEAGTMKPGEHFQREQGNMRLTQFDTCGVSTILFPDTKRVIPYYNFDEAIDGFNGLTGLRTILTATTSKLLR